VCVSLEGLCVKYVAWYGNCLTFSWNFLWTFH